MDLTRASREDLGKEIVRLNAELEAQRFAGTQVQRGGHTIIMPDNMSMDEAIRWLQRRKEEEETVVAVRHEIAAHPADGAVALSKALSQLYGWSMAVPTPGFFGPKPPVFINVKTGVKTSVSVPWGRMALPGIAGVLYTGADLQGEDPIFIVGAEVKQRDRARVVEIAKLTENILKDESIYKGQALSINLSKHKDEDFDPARHGFQFVDLTGVDPNQLVFDKATTGVLDNTLFAFIENAEAMRANHIPLKRGILLEGPYGVGKTLTANITAKKSVDNGFTFILVEDARDLDAVVKMARRYEPCVIFCEDIDRVVFDQRTLTVDALLNTIDGIESKTSEVIIVLTTNHVEKINKALLRPGRLDSVVSLMAPDAEAATRLVRLYGRDNLLATDNFEKVGEQLAGQIPAVIREIVERAKVAAIRRTNSSDVSGQISAADLMVTAEGMQRHLALLSEKKVGAPSPQDQLFTAIGAAVVQGLHGTNETLVKQLGEVDTRTKEIKDRLG
jgi:transitional endoplasmic reticulum ATPase